MSCHTADIDRRTFLSTIGVAVLGTAFAAEAQQAAKTPRMGYLSFGRTPTLEERTKRPFIQGMKELGWVDGQNILIEWRFRESDDQLHEAAAELVRLKVDVLVVPSCGVATIARKHSRAIPIVILG